MVCVQKMLVMKITKIINWIKKQQLKFSDN
jgi:hypothetical protein